MHPVSVAAEINNPCRSSTTDRAQVYLNFCRSDTAIRYGQVQQDGDAPSCCWPATPAWDVSQRSLSFWWADPWGTLTPVFLDELAAHWPGWRLHPLNDEYETHVRLTEGRWQLRSVPTQTLLEKIQERLTSAYHTEPDARDRKAILDTAIVRWQQHRAGDDRSGAS